MGTDPGGGGCPDYSALSGILGFARAEWRYNDWRACVFPRAFKTMTVDIRPRNAPPTFAARTPFHLPHAPEVRLELCEDTEHVVERLSRRAVRVDGLSRGHDVDALLEQLVHDVPASCARRSRPARPYTRCSCALPMLFMMQATTYPALANGRSLSLPARPSRSLSPARPCEAPKASHGPLNSLLQLRHALLEPGHVLRKRRVAGSLLAQAQENGMPLP
jgi:hypothetical protein